ncbi:MAG TPA: thiopurine S-methyltransferase, partial [Pseudomonas sp.]|nr:thiopurine S-methyltransferase [Pseudomonas sp.]
MDEGFWQARWSLDQIGFHLAEVNPYLQRHWPILDLPAQARVLVPLCGKSLDLAWLAAQGLR